MACATLKRNLDWETVSQLPTKRRRCSPYAPSTSPGLKIAENRPSPFGENVPSSSKMTPERMAQEICDEIKRLHRRRQLRMASEAVAGAGVGVGGAVVGAAAALEPGWPSASSCSSSGSEGDASPPHRPRAHAYPRVPARPHHRALFTFKQVRMICERMLREQEAALRAEYEAALSGKLAEQYEAFVRFNLDQVQRHHHVPLHSHSLAHSQMHQEPPSYLS